MSELKSTASGYHIPVMLQECIEGLAIRPDGVYVDATFGGGGHSRAILAQLNEHGRLLAFDQDADAKNNLPDDPRLIFVHANFADMKSFLRVHGYREVDGILADLGVSLINLTHPNVAFLFALMRRLICV
jgi:16S rRNA (cytosine1402-N4)-methyltransferase